MKMINNPKLVAQLEISCTTITKHNWEFNSNSNIINTILMYLLMIMSLIIILLIIITMIMILRTYYQKNYGLKFKNLYILRSILKRSMRLIIIDMLKHSWMDQNVWGIWWMILAMYLEIGHIKHTMFLQ